MEVINISETTSIVNQYIAEIRDKNYHTNRMVFRKNIERIGEIIAYHVSQSLEYKSQQTTTPLGVANDKVLAEQPIIGCILRAALAMHNGFLNVFDKADSIFISAYRKHISIASNEFSIETAYVSGPDLSNRDLILCDPMLATAASMAKIYKMVTKEQKPKHTHFVAVVASKAGIETLQQEIQDENTTLWVAVIDPELDEKAYIVPGIGDAGDLAYGEKL
jgi:uracil phosphoribosyltransferase